MNENKKLFTILGIVAAIVVVIIISSIMGTKQEAKTMEDIEKMIKSDKKQLIYLGRPTCTYCQQFQPIIEELSDTYQYGYYYINTDDISSTNLSKILELLNIDEGNFGTPTLVVMQKGKQEAIQPGYTDREGLFKFLQENEIISKDAVYEADDANLNKVDYAQYKEVIASDEEQVVVFAQTGCSHCESARPALNAIAKEHNLKISYLNITDLSTNDQKDFTNSLDILSEGFGTPLTVIVKNNKVIDSIEGFESKDTMIDFFKKNNLIKE